MRSKLLLATLAVLCVNLLAISDAQSAPASFSFLVDGTDGVYGAPGSTLVLATQTVESEEVGRSCQVSIDVHNNESVRQGTDLLVSSAGVSLTAANVEALAGDAPEVPLGSLVLGATVTGSVRFGPRGEASTAATIVVDCPDAPITPTPPPTVSPDTVVRGAEVSAVEVAGVMVVQPSFTG